MGAEPLMAGNSQRRGRTTGAGKKTATAGTGGKTRRSLQLAADVAYRFHYGLWFVALEPVRDPGMIGNTICDGRPRSTYTVLAATRTR